MYFKTILIAILLMLSGCSTMSVNSDYDPSFKFEQLKTFHLFAPLPEATNTLTQDRVAKAVIKELELKGYTLASEKYADFYIVFKSDVTQKEQSVIEYRSVGYYQYVGNSAYLFPLSVPIRQNYRFKERKIVLNAIDPETKKVFWQTVATDRLKNFKTPQKRIEYIEKLMNKSLETFPSR